MTPQDDTKLAVRRGAAAMAAVMASLFLRGPAPAAESQPPGAKVQVMRTGSGELRWERGSAFVSVRDARGRERHRIRLARPGLTPKGAQVRALLPERGRSFLIVEELREEYGLHLKSRRPRAKTKLVVVASLLRLVGDSGRAIWERKVPEATAVGDSRSLARPQIAGNGTVAVLLEDLEPFSKNNSLLYVVGHHGQELLQLDYTAWRRIDEFVLSEDGKALAVRGFGVLPDEDEMTDALGYYVLPGGVVWVKPISPDQNPRALASLDAKGWACCVRTDEGVLAFDKAGRSRPMVQDNVRQGRPPEDDEPPDD